MTTLHQKLKKFPKYILETYGAHASLSKLGFKDEDMFLGFGNVLGYVEKCIYILLRAQNKEFVFVVGPAENETRESLFIKWNSFREWVSQVPDDDLEACYRETTTGKDIDEFSNLALTLSLYGFVLPALTN